MDYLDDLHNQFVIVPVDRDAKNIWILCKLFYLQVLKEEISSGTDIQSDKLTDIINILHDYSSHLKDKYDNIALLHNLPFVYHNSIEILQTLHSLHLI